MRKVDRTEDEYMLMCCAWFRGHYSDAVLDSLESQNDENIAGISAKVQMLKDVS